MAARRASAQFLTNFSQRSNITTGVQPSAALRQPAALASRQLYSESQAKLDNEHTAEYESNKMTAEGGGNARGVASFEEESEKVKNQAGGKVEEMKGKASDVKESVAEKSSETKSQVGNQVDKNVDTAKDMFKDFPQKVSETATGLKEVGVEAAKSVQRDASKIAQKVGLKNED